MRLAVYIGIVLALCGCAKSTPVVPPAAAIPPVFDFKGIKLGSSVGELKTVVANMRCPETRPDRIFFSCNTDISQHERSSLREDETGFGSIPASFSAIFVQGKLSSLAVTVKSSSFATAFDMLSHRLGNPTSSTRGELQTVGGSRHEASIFWWERPDSSLRAIKFHEDAQTSRIEYWAYTKEQVVAGDRLLRAERAKGL